MAPDVLTRLFRRSQTNSPPRRVNPAHRIYAGGDDHGRADLLRAVLDKIAEDSAARQDARQTIYVFLGDYVDRGDHSKEVLDLLCTLRATDGETALFLRGNHEAALLAFLDDPEGGARWLEFGGARTLKSYGLDPAQPLPRLRDAFHATLGPHLDFLQETERFWTSGDIVFVHAALHPRRALADQEDRELYWGNAAFLRGKGPKGVQVVHGHYNGPEPVVTSQRICVDTGAYYSDRLTAVRLDEEIGFLTSDD